MSGFEVWAKKNNLDITIFDGKYFNGATEMAYKGWVAKDAEENSLFQKYGICKECETHYTKVADFGALHNAMECKCTTDGYTPTIIMDLIDQIHNRGQYDEFPTN